MTKAKKNENLHGLLTTLRTVCKASENEQSLVSQVLNTTMHALVAAYTLQNLEKGEGYLMPVKDIIEFDKNRKDFLQDLKQLPEQCDQIMTAIIGHISSGLNDSPCPSPLSRTYSDLVATQPAEDTESDGLFETPPNDNTELFFQPVSK
jgi:hypothetical protein